MGALLVTVAGPGSRIDAALPDDSPLREVVPALVLRSVPEPRAWSRWALGPLGGEAFPPGQTLRSLGVLSGAELQLRDMVAPEGDPAGQGPGTARAASGSDADREGRRQRVTDLAERLVGDVAGIRAGRNPLLEYAATEARRRLRALAPGPFDRSAQNAFSGLSLAVTWHHDPRAPIEALARFTEVAASGTGAPRPGAAAAARRISVQMTLDPPCRHLLEVTVSADPPLS